MDGQYNPKSCNSLEKPSYTPVEAAIRWCGLFKHEDYILDEMRDYKFPRGGTFLQWPCLRANIEKIYDAIADRSLLARHDGTRDKHPYVTPGSITIRHNDLKQWMTKYYPDQKPAFLFDEIERTIHAAISTDTFMALQADRDALNVRLNTLETDYRATKDENNVLRKKVDDLTGELESIGVPDERSERSYQNIIVALLDYISGNVPRVGKHQDFKSEARLIDAIVAQLRRIILPTFI